MNDHPVSALEVQSLLQAQEQRHSDRHSELLSRLDKLDERLRYVELEVAERRPVIRGATGAIAMLAAALVAGYVGSLFTG